MKHVSSALLATGVAIAALTLPARAQVTQTDLLVAGRALGFINNLKHGSAVRVGIVYDPNIAQSAQQAEQLNTQLGSGMRTGTLTLKPVMVPIDKLSATQIDALLLTTGLGAEGAKIGQASRARKLPCVTFDLDQVRNGFCALGVRARPKIEVLLNNAAAAACGLDIATVFRMMITEI